MRLNRIATPLTLASFLTVCITGLLLLFNYHGSWVNPVHEVSSLVFIAGSLLHMKVNLGAVMAHLKRPLGAALATVCMLATVMAALPSRSQQENPRKTLALASNLVLDAPLSSLATVTHQPVGNMVQHLTAAGFQVPDEHATLRATASASHRDPLEAMAALLGEHTSTQPQ